MEGTGATDARGLRILLAHDLSDAADIAATLVASARWPAGTTVRIVTSPAGVGGPLSSFANLSEVRAHVGEVRSWIEDEQSRLATDLMAAGLERQWRRKDLPAPLRERLQRARSELWAVIQRSSALRTSELWSWSWSGGKFQVQPFGRPGKDVDESNAAQLWSTVYLGLRPPGDSPAATP